MDTFLFIGFYTVGATALVLALRAIYIRIPE